MDPFSAKSIEALAHVRRRTKGELRELQHASDLVIEDMETSVENKIKSTTKLIASAKKRLKQLATPQTVRLKHFHYYLNLRNSFWKN